MAVQTWATIKDYFSAGKFPTQQNYEDLIDTIMSMQGGGSTGDAIRVITCGYSSDLIADDFTGNRYGSNLFTLSNNYITNPEKAVPIEAIVSVYNRKVAEGGTSLEAIDENTKILIIDNQTFFYGLSQQPEMYVSTYEFSAGDFSGNYTFVTEIPIGRIGVFAKSGETWKYVGGASASDAQQSDSSIPVIILDNYSEYGVESYIYETYNDYVDYSSNPYIKTKIEHIIGAAMINSINITVDGNLTEHTKQVIIVNTGFGESEDLATPAPVYVSCSNSIDGNNGITTIGRLQCAMFAKVGDIWMPIGRSIGITEYELSQLQQNANGNGSGS